MISPWLLIAVAYLLGSIPFGYLVVKACGGDDIRNSGSGNIGAANVTRTAGISAGLLTLLLDAAKGYSAVWIAQRYTLVNESPRWMMIAAVAAVIGHCFPLWLRFRGGKGVATALGVFIPICPEAVLAAIALWLLIVAFWRYTSLASITAAATLPIFVYLFYAPRHAPPHYVTFGTLVISLIVLVKHRSNMERLVTGTEPRLKLFRK